MSAVYTIGHGNRTIDEFIAMLHAAQVRCLFDVRAFPGSRRHPHFGRSELEQSLPGNGINYVWEGSRLGGRRRPRADSPHVAMRNASFRAYADHMETEPFREGVERVLQEAAQRAVAIMCAERLPWQCHRYMIADYLVAQGMEVLHLMDGTERRHAMRAEARVETGGDGATLVYDRLTQESLKL